LTVNVYLTLHQLRLKLLLTENRDSTDDSDELTEFVIFYLKIVRTLRLQDNRRQCRAGWSRYWSLSHCYARFVASPAVSHVSAYRISIGVIVLPEMSIYSALQCIRDLPQGALPVLIDVFSSSVNEVSVNNLPCTENQHIS